jgi:hypothetical protein
VIKKKGKKRKSIQSHLQMIYKFISIYQVRAWQMIGTCIHLNIYFVNIIYYLIKH